MPLKLTAPLEKTFVLEISDEVFGNDGDPTTVTIRQARQDAIEKRSYIYSEVTNILNATVELGAEMMLRQKWSIEQLNRMEVFLTMVGCDVLDVDGQPLFKFRSENGRQVLDMSERQFNVAWGKLDGVIASEIHSKVLEVNPNWGGPLAK
jgi:hypothetical protein